MSGKRNVEIFSAGCSVCQDVIDLVSDIACPSCAVVVSNMQDPEIAARAKALGVKTVPAVAIDGKLAECCSGMGVNEASLRAAGIGQPLA